MSAVAAFKKLTVHRLRGVEPGFTLDEISSGVNVVYGPNGVGKSRTVCALTLAVWPRGLPGQDGWISADLEIAGEPWHVEVDGSSVRHQRRGGDSDPPPLPDAGVRDRYHLALHDLLQVKDEALAKAILRESAGGYDLAAAAASLDFKPPGPRAIKETESLGKALASLREADARQGELRSREHDLKDLENRRSGSRGAAGRVKLLEAALQYASALERRQLATSALAEFDVRVQKLLGNELQLLGQLRRAVDETKKDFQRHHEEIAAAGRELDTCRLEPGQADPAVAKALVTQIAELSQLDGQIGTEQVSNNAARAQREKARAAMGPAVTDKQLAALGHVQVQELANLAREAEKVRAERSAAEALRQWLGPTPTTADLHRLEEGLKLLQQWLRVPDAPADAGQGARPVLIAAAVIVLVSILLAVLVNVWLIAVALAAPALVLGARRRPTVAAGAAAPRVVFRDAYLKLGLPAPGAWSAAEVEQLCGTLFEQVAARSVDREKAARWADLQPRQQNLAQRGDALERRCEEVASAIGVAPGLDESAMYLIAQAIEQWRQADSQLAAADEKLKQLRSRRGVLWEAAFATASGYGYRPADCAELSAAAEQIRTRIDTFLTAAGRTAAARAAIGQLEQRARQQSEDLSNFFTKLGLDDGSEETLRRWLEVRPAYALARDELQNAEHDVRSAEAALAAAPQLKSQQRGELEAMLAEASEQAAELETVAGEIATIQAGIEKAKHASDLQAALIRRSDCIAALLGVRENDCDQLAGHVLVEHLRAATRDRNRPPVFRRAQDVFARVTRGRYRLEFDDGTEATFRATDTTTGAGHALDELSSGTRLQLLLSVRVAFVEEQEQGVKLPLLLDETLANADEIRAAAIIDAVIEIARAGRQVFYFTAQPDEAVKWRDRLRGSGVEHRLSDLAAVRNLAATDRMPLRDVPAAALPAVASQQGLTREQYGALLQVPGLDFSAEVGGTHLWHLMDDMAVLERLLQLGIKNWGQWRTLHEHAKDGPLARGEIYEKTAARARLLESLARNWRIGRGRPVNRQTIVDSDAISSHFLDQTSAIAAEVGGDARKLIHQLEDRAVKRIRATDIEGLKASLQASGHLDEREPLTADELRQRVTASVGEELHAGILEPGDLDRYLFQVGVSEPAAAGRT